MNPTGNTILITGGSSGIGLALAQAFAALQNTVIIVGRDAQKLAQVQQAHPALIPYSCDLTDQKAVEALAQWVGEHYPRLNILVNNAAVQYNYSFLENHDLAAKIDYEIGANLTAPITLTTLLLPALRQNPEAAVVNVSSALFLAPKQSASVYCATKAAIHSYSQTLHYQLEPIGVKVFEIIPALMDTPMTAGRPSAKMQPELLVDAFLRAFRRDRYECYIGKSKLLWLMHRLSPTLANRLMKNGQ